MRIFALAVVASLLLVGCEDLATDDSASDLDSTTRAVQDECSRRELGEDAEAVFLTAHRVIDGELDAVCLGTPERDLEAIWEDLAAMAPPSLRMHLAVVSLFEAPESDSEVTLAFVTPIDDAGTRFHMAFNATVSGEDPDELLLTTAHEFSHVFTGTPDEIDRTIQPADCTTYDNGEGCYREESRILAWIDEFWSDDQLADVGTDEPDVIDGEERCDADPGFLGPYAATTPEEDFAESFSAFVLDVRPASPAQAERISWFEDDPQLVEVRDRARVAGLGPLDNIFELCG